MNKGTITVFLSLVLTLVLSLISACIEGARVAAIRSRIEMVSDMGLYSVFAEYNRELLKSYDLYYIDTSYGKGKPSLENTREHFKSYVSYNLDPSKGQLSFFDVDMLKLKCSGVSLDAPSYATDNAGRVFKRQAIRSVKDRFGINILNSVKNNLSTYKAGDFENDRADKQIEKIQKKMDSLDWEGAKNPVSGVLDKRDGIIDLIMNRQRNISEKSFELNSVASHRKLNEGIGLVKPAEDPDSFTNELLFDEYLMWKCGNFRKLIGHEDMSYEIEYILNGKNTDKANLRETINKLFIVHLAKDVAAVMSDGAKKEECKSVALVISSLLLLPELEEVLTEFFLLSWGFAEAVVDVRTLLNGGRVSLIKTGDDFNIKNLAGCLAFMTMKGRSAEESQGGLSYEDHLRIFLALQNKSEKVMRSIDVIELYMRTREGNSSFKMDSCLEYVQSELTVKSGFGYEYSIRREFAYEPVIE
ncbi:MAG: DUF5702 domain-containing protein [Lachnospiraceae bacterium]|nr:DUF5702 domain-containing protein [Lachnospiraceae bacterium]